MRSVPWNLLEWRRERVGGSELGKGMACLLEKQEEVSQVGTSRPCLAQESGLGPLSLAGESPLAPGGAVSAGRRGEHKTLVSESGPRLCWLSSLGRMEESTLGGTLDVCSGAWELGGGGLGERLERRNTVHGLLDGPAGGRAQRPSRAGRPREEGTEALEMGSQVRCSVT